MIIGSFGFRDDRTLFFRSTSSHIESNRCATIESFNGWALALPRKSLKRAILEVFSLFLQFIEKVECLNWRRRVECKGSDIGDKRLQF